MNDTSDLRASSLQVITNGGYLRHCNVFGTSGQVSHAAVGLCLSALNLGLCCEKAHVTRDRGEETGQQYIPFLPLHATSRSLPFSLLCSKLPNNCLVSHTKTGCEHTQHHLSSVQEGRRRCTRHQRTDALMHNCGVL